MRSDAPAAPDARSRRKPYVRPSVSQVPLRMEEAVLGNCKISGAAGPLQASCATPACSDQGS